MTQPTRPPPVKSAMRTLDLIELVVARHQGIQAREIASILAIPMSSLSYLLTTMCERGYLERDGRLYRPGPGLARLRLPESELSLPERMATVVRSLRHELNETVSFMVREGWEAVVLLTEASDQALRYAIAPGEHRPLHALAAGKALLATLDEDELDAYFRETPLARYTERTITDEAALRAELAQVRRTGHAEAREESTPGICSIGKAVSLDGAVVGALGIAIPTVRFTQDLRDRAARALGRN